jgi:hypothetical protein
LFRLYREERLTVRRRGGRKRALGTRAPMIAAQLPNDRWLPEAMQAHAKSKGFLGPFAHGSANSFTTHRASLIGCPEAGVLIGTGYTATEALQVQSSTT